MQFPCPTCNATLSLPDDSPGKKAQCPNCQAVFRVPETVEYSDRAVSGLPTAQFRPGRTDAVACPGCDKLLAFNAESAGHVAVCPACQRRLRFPTFAEISGGQNTSTRSTPRPIGYPLSSPVDAPSPPLSQDNLQPYAAPPSSSEIFRNSTPTNYTTPGWFLLGTSVLNLGYDFLWIAIIGFSMMNDKLDADAVMGFGAFLAWGAISILLHATSLVAGLRMTQRRSLSIARLGAFFGLVPCGICAVVQLPFAIWALFAVYSANAPADFSE